MTPLEIPAPLVAVRPPRLEAPSLTSVDTADGLYFPMLSGSAEPGAAITVSNGPLPDVVVAAASDGTWSTPQLEGLPAGRSTIDVAQTLRGATSATTTATVDLVPPTIVASRGALVNGLFPLPITGHPGAHVTVLIEGSSSAQATLDATGGATVSIPFASGQAPLTMTARYGAPGRSGPSSGRMSLTLDLTG
ncbi:hypothetical protein [Leifsonia poae]|uniref:hypothetical protein n=1 Tax=Leifsonia poae TaxID=110933 RepID=UPI003D67AD97